MAIIAHPFCLFLLWTAVSSSACPDNTAKIASGACMPLINLGGVHSKPSNYSLWLELGGRGLDTAWAYGDDVQKSVGDAVAASSTPRADLFITTKIPCCPDGHSFGGYACSTWQGKGPADVVNEAAHSDLELLGVTHVDLLLLHSPCDTMEDTVAAYRALEGLKASGKARAIGISNFNASLIDALMKQTTVLPAVNQCAFSIAGYKKPSKGSDLETLKRCQQLGITYAAYSPLGGLSGIDLLHDPDVIAIAGTHNKSAAEVALRWVVQQGVVAVTASNKESHDRGDLDVFSFALSDEEMARLTAKGDAYQLLV